MNHTNTKRFNFLIDSFPYAYSIAKILKNLLIANKFSILNITQIDAFPGLFTKNLFLASKDLEINSKINYLIHESDKKHLLDIKTKILQNYRPPLKFELSCLPSEKLVESTALEIVILNNFLSSNSYDILQKILMELTNSNKTKLIIGCEAINSKLSQFSEFENFKFWNFNSATLIHYAYFNQVNHDIQYQKFFDEEFKNNNNYEKYLDLIKVLNTITCPEASTSIKFVLDELIRLDGYSANSHLLISKFLKITGDDRQAKVHFEIAKKLDAYKLLKIHP